MASGTQRDASVTENTLQSGRQERQRRDGSVSGHEPQGGYDFQRLERSVEFLLEEHARLGAEREAILAELADREHRISQLEAEVTDERSRRAAAVEGVDKILSRLEQLQASVRVSGAPNANSPNADGPNTAGKSTSSASERSKSGATQ